MENDKIKDLFQKKFSTHEMQVSYKDWEIIEKRLKRKKKIHIILYYNILPISIAASLIIFFAINAGKTDIDAKSEITAKTNEQTTNNKETIKVIKQGGKNDTENLNEITTKTISGKEQYQKKYKPTTTSYTAQSAVSEQKSRPKLNKIIVENISISITKINNDKKTDVDSKQRKTINNDNDKIYWAEMKSDNKQKEKWTLALALSQNLNKQNAFSNYTNKVYPQMNIMRSRTETRFSTNQFAISDKIELKHKRPINVGVRITKKIIDRMLVKTGMLYSYLESEYKNTDIKIEQEIHYIGIPLGAEFSIIKSNKFDLYLTAEAIAEKGIAVRYKETGITSDMTAYTVKRNNTVRGVQFSTNTGFGASYKIAKNIAIYTEPSIFHYFKDSKQPESYRTQKQTNFNVNFGFKINLN